MKWAIDIPGWVIWLSLYLLTDELPWWSLSSRSACIPYGPVVSNNVEVFGIIHQHLGDLGILGILRVRRLEEHSK